VTSFLSRAVEQTARYVVTLKHNEALKKRSRRYRKEVCFTMQEEVLRSKQETAKRLSLTA